MGSESKAKAQRKAETIHRKQLFGGRYTAEELNTAIGVRKRCVGCGQPGSIRIRVYVPLQDLYSRAPEFAAQIMVTNPKGAEIPSVPMCLSSDRSIVTKMVLLSDVGVCSLCRGMAEREAAKGPGPDWRGVQHIVEISRGPGPEKPVVQVPGSFSDDQTE